MRSPVIATVVTLFAFFSTAFCRDVFPQALQQGTQSLVPRVAAIEVYFSPNGGAEQAILDELNAAKKSILVLAYSFTSAPIARALSQAKGRGVDVRVILDKSQMRARYSVVNYLQSRGVSVFIDIPHAIAHNKVMIVDGKDVITGSYNFTASAEKRNAENLVIIRNNLQIAEVYVREWHRLNHKSVIATSHPTIVGKR